MRYSDTPVVEVRVLVAAPPVRVWDLVSDIEVIAEFSRETQSVRWLDGDGGAAVGRRFQGVNAHPAVGEWTTESTVVVCEPERAFQWDVGPPEAPAASWGYELTPAEGGTQVRGWGRLGPGWSNLSAAIEKWPEKEEKIVARRLEEFRAGIAATLAGIKARAES